MTQPKPVGKASEPLEKPAQFGIKCVADADAKPDQEDIDRLCSSWAEVGRAILTRRKTSSETQPD